MDAHGRVDGGSRTGTVTALRKTRKSINLAPWAEGSDKTRILRFSSKDMDDVDDQFVLFGHAIGCPLRLALLRVLGEDGLTLTQAADVVGVAPSTAFYHFSVLMGAGLVKRKGRRRGSRYTWPEKRWELVCREHPKDHAPPMATTERT